MKHPCGNARSSGSKTLLGIVTGVATLAMLVGPMARGQDLGFPPALLDPELVVLPRLQTEADVALIDRSRRSAVVAAFHADYLASQNVTIGWNGNTANCTLGDNTVAHRQATLRRVNYFRAMAGLPGNVALDELRSDKCLRAAMMMSAQGQLSHSPGTSWMCYSPDGAEAAGKSNIALGAEGPGAVDLYMDDHGGGNFFVGHRRWILHPPQAVMGTGSVPAGGGKSAANALWVIAPFGSRPAGPEFVAWPSPGYFPHQLLPALSTRWSFSIPGANFSNTTVTVTRDGQSLATTTEENRNDQGFGDNTLVWRVSGVPSSAPAKDTAYNVTLNSVTVSGQTRNFTYTVTVIDPYKPDLDVRVAMPNITLVWPVGPSGFQVQTGAFGGTSINWGVANLTPTIVGREHRVTVSPTNASRLFRLRKN